MVVDISIEDPEGEMQQPSDEPSDNTDSNDVTDNTEPEVGFADDLFSSGDNMTELGTENSDCTGNGKYNCRTGSIF